MQSPGGSPSPAGGKAAESYQAATAKSGPPTPTAKVMAKAEAKAAATPPPPPAPAVPETPPSAVKQALAAVGAGLATLTEVEMKLSMPMRAIPMPGIPALRVGDMAMGLPHAHSHPPNLTPPNPVPIPLPGMGPIIPIPMISGSTTVMINGQPAARCGDMGMSIFCGGLFPMYEVFLGSSSVWIEGARAGRLLTDITKHCVFSTPKPNDPPIGPMLGMTMPPASITTKVGGVPMPSLTNMAVGHAMGAMFKMAGKAVGKVLAIPAVEGAIKAALGKLGLVGDMARNAFNKTVCFFTGHPVEVATGKVLTEQVDFTAPGPLPLRWERVWYSTSAYRGPLGHGWHHAYDSALLVIGDEAVAVRTADGREQAFLPVAVGSEQYDRKERTTLFRDQRGYGLRFADGLCHRFAEVVPGEPQRLVAIEAPAGHSIRFAYDRWGRLSRMVDSGGRELAVTCDDQGRITRITAPHATEPGRQQTLVGYRYDDQGDLVEAADALDHAMRFEYRKHLLVKETNRNGLSFQFEYDGEGPSARCVHTWGDGGIYDHKLRYEPDTTTVVDSLGGETIYRHAGGLVTSIVDPLGGTTAIQYSEFGERLREVDALGRTTVSRYDRRGNLVELKRPDGATVAMRYERDRLVAALDPNGGAWRWGYDERGCLVERGDPVGRTVRFEYTGANLTGFIDPSDQKTELAYDAAGNLSAMRTPDKAERRWQSDRRGRVVAAIDPKGNVQRREHDALDRVIRVVEPDGAVRALEYDSEGNLLSVKDQQRHVQFTYLGMGRPATRSEAGTTVAFEYDKEERLVAIRNEQGAVYRFVLDARGEVVEEIAFDGARRRYGRDLAGQVTRVERPAGHSDYRHDRAGRVVAATHSDGTSEAYRYRADGEMLEARNDAAAVLFDRDPLGRVLRETVGEDWVESQYGPLGLRTELRSSRGFEQTITRNAVGDVLAVGAQAGPEDRARFEATFTRDALGLELERSLPGGVRARWERDQLGRPVRHDIRAGASFSASWTYSWDLNDRLRSITETGKGPIHYRHDAVGNLAAAVYADGKVDLRMPDAVGNLFRTEDRSDRKYGPAGQLLEARGPEGLTRYDYDAEGRLIRKTEPSGRQWLYHWNATAMLTKVVRPDGHSVEFTYDALGRRLSKKFRGKTTRWIWDGNVPLHEWTEVAAEDVPFAAPNTARADQAAAVRKGELRVAHSPQGPPADGTTGPLTTWLFEPGISSPIGKLVEGDSFSIVTDHIGTPRAMFDARGGNIWSAEIDAYGSMREVAGDKTACPFRWPGQYEDPETGLYYNRHRYYDPAAGTYISADPVGLAAGLTTYGYVRDPLTWIDPLGLNACEGLVRGEENIRRFPSLNEARSAARTFAGVGDDAVDFVQEIGPMKGRVTGRMSPDAKRGWRVDFDDEKGFHVNWWDRTGGTKRAQWTYGANVIEGGTEDHFQSLVQHFPQR